MRVLWVTLLPTLVLSIPVEKSTNDDKISNKTIPGPNSAKPFIGIGAGWNPFYNTGREFQVKADEGISGIITEVGSVMTAMSNIFDIFGPTKKINPKSYGNSPSADEVEFIGPVNKFLNMFGTSKSGEETTTGAATTPAEATEDTSAVTDLPVTELTSEAGP